MNSSKKSSGSLKRVLGRQDVMALAFGAMIGWGWVALAGNWVLSAGALGAFSAFIIGGVAVILIGLTYAELASAMPITGGEHVYSYRAMGVKWSFICTWAMLLGYISVIAFEAVALPTVLEYIFPHYKVGYLYTVAGWDVYATWVLVGIIGSIVMMWINYRGVKSAALFQKVVTILILIAGAMLMSGALLEGDTAKADPLFTEGYKGIMGVIVMVPLMFIGFDVIPQAAEEIDLPYKEIGKILIVSVIIATCWYAFITLSVAVALDTEELKNSSLPVADAMSALVGATWGGKLIVLAGLGGIVTSWNAFYVGGSRAIYAMARARMLPSFLAKLHPVYNTPVNAIILIGIISTLAPLMGRKSMVWLVDAGGLGIIVAYALVALSFLILRKKAPEMKRPFRAPMGRLVGWSAIVLSAGIGALYLPGSPAALTPPEWAIVVGWVLFGILLYVMTSAQHSESEVKAILDAEINSNHTLSQEEEKEAVLAR
ncbi:MAG: APC family permease [Amphritea sp.]|nr:APC family permease [Amphritea sp.]